MCMFSEDGKFNEQGVCDNCGACDQTILGQDELDRLMEDFINGD